MQAKQSVHEEQTDMCTEMCTEMCRGMCIDMCIDMCMDMCIDICQQNSRCRRQSRSVVGGRSPTQSPHSHHNLLPNTTCRTNTARQHGLPPTLPAANTLRHSPVSRQSTGRSQPQRSRSADGTALDVALNDDAVGPPYRLEVPRLRGVVDRARHFFFQNSTKPDSTAY